MKKQTYLLSALALIVAFSSTCYAAPTAGVTNLIADSLALEETIEYGCTAGIISELNKYNNFTKLTVDNSNIEQVKESNLKSEEVKETSPLDKYTEDELYKIVAVVYAEQGYGSDINTEYTTSVIINRIYDKQFGNTVDTVLIPSQYWCVDPEHPTYLQYYEAYKYHNDFYYQYQERFDYVWEKVIYVLEQDGVLPRSVVYQAEFEQGSEIFDKVGNTFYCYK